MKATQILLLFCLLIGTWSLGWAQVGINTDGSNPDPSAMLDVKSTTQGMLVPRMSSSQRSAIANPATGLLVFETTSGSFWFYSGTVWQNLSTAGTPDKIADTDGNTQIQTEESTNENVIRFDVNGAERMSLNVSRLTVRSTTGLHFPNTFGPNPSFVGTPGNSISFGHAGVSEDFIGYYNNTFYFKDSPGGGDVTDPNIATNGTIFAGAFVGNGAGLTNINVNDADADATNEIQTLSLSVDTIKLSNGGGAITLPAIATPDTALPIPIRFQGTEIFVHPDENATSVDWTTAQTTCTNLTAFGFSDWYLPSRLELDAMYKQSYLITGLSQTDMAKYWSNTELDANNAYSQRLDYGGPDPDAKTDATGHNCRCVRKN